MFKLINQITALALVPHVMSRQLKTIDSSKDWIELTTDQVEEYRRIGGLFLRPGEEIKLGLSYKENVDKWLQSTDPTNKAWTVKEEIDGE